MRRLSVIQRVIEVVYCHPEIDPGLLPCPCDLQRDDDPLRPLRRRSGRIEYRSRPLVRRDDIQRRVEEISRVANAPRRVETLDEIVVCAVDRQVPGPAPPIPRDREFPVENRHEFFIRRGVENHADFGVPAAGVDIEIVMEPVHERPGFPRGGPCGGNAPERVGEIPGNGGALGFLFHPERVVDEQEPDRLRGFIHDGRLGRRKNE